MSISEFKWFGADNYFWGRVFKGNVATPSLLKWDVSQFCSNDLVFDLEGLGSGAWVKYDHNSLPLYYNFYCTAKVKFMKENFSHIVLFTNLNCRLQLKF